MTGRRLKVLVVSEDRRTLRHIAQFLNVFGYDPRQAASVDQAQMALEAGPPDFLILDGDLADAGGLQLAQSDGSYRGAGQTYTFLLVNGVQPRTLIEALEAGVDDFLTKPIVHGEVVVRLRAAARALEYDRRLQAQMGVDRSTDMPNRRALRTRLAQELNRSATGSRSPACVGIGIDALERINRSSGHPTGDRLIRDVAGVLQDQCEDGQWVASFGGGRFGVLLPQRSVGEAVEWAEAVHATLEKTEFVCADKVLASPAVPTQRTLPVKQLRMPSPRCNRPRIPAVIAWCSLPSLTMRPASGRSWLRRVNCSKQPAFATS